MTDNASRSNSTAHSTRHRGATSHPVPTRHRHRARVAAIAASITASIAAVTVSGTPAQAIDTGGANEIVNAAGINASSVGRLNRKIEQKIAECMKKEGFQYTPDGTDIPADAADGGASNREAFVKKYGYGVSTVIDPTKKQTQNPNEAYIAKLSKAEKAAYNKALLGFDPETNPTQQFGPKSCVGQALSLLGNLDAIQGLQQKIDDLTKRINADPKVVKAMRDWSGCMKSAGFTFAKDTEVDRDFATRLGKLRNAGGTFDPSGLTKLQKTELETAKADWDCSKKHLGARDKVASELNKAFVAENRAILENVKKVINSK